MHQGKALTPAQVTTLLDAYRYGNEAVADLALRYGVSRTTVRDIVAGRTWAEVTGGVNHSRRVADRRYRRTHVAGRLDQGETNYRKIADELGITRQAVRKIAADIKRDGGTNARWNDSDSDGAGRGSRPGGTTADPEVLREGGV